jgi:hypothetical protein
MKARVKATGEIKEERVYGISAITTFQILSMT